MAAEIEEKVVLNTNRLGLKESLPDLQDSTLSLVLGNLVI